MTKPKRSFLHIEIDAELKKKAVKKSKAEFVSISQWVRSLIRKAK